MLVVAETWRHPYGYRWREADSALTIADLLASPHAAGYSLVGHAAAAPESLGVVPPVGRAMRRDALVWLSAADRPSAPGNAAVRALRGELELIVGGAPPALQAALAPFVPPMPARDSALFARMGRMPRPEERQPGLPLTLRLEDGGVRAETTLVAAGRRLRVVLERVDTTSMRRSY